MVKDEYKYNARFREFVDRYCKEHGVTTGEALAREEVKRASKYYADL